MEMITAHFENIKSVIIEQLRKAKKSVKVISAYFSDSDLFDILCTLSKRGIEVELIISDDPMNTNESKIKFVDFLDSNGNLYLTNRSPAQTLVHHKFCIIDDELMITGSYNWTTKASLNRENIIIIDNKKTIQEYLKEFDFVKDEYSKIFTSWEEIIIPSGFHEIDSIIKGFKPNELICLTGKSGIGTTNFLINISLNISCEFGIPIGFISSDLDTKTFPKKLLSLATGIQIYNIKNTKLETYEMNLLSQVAGRIKSDKFHFEERAISLNELERKCKALWYKGVKLIIIDKIDHLLSNHGDELDNGRNRDVLGRFKSLSRLLRIPIVFVIGINNNTSHKSSFNSKKSILDNLGIISHYTDIVISIHRDDYYGIEYDDSGNLVNDKAEINILKNLNGYTGVANLKYNSTTGCFHNLENDNQN